MRPLNPWRPTALALLGAWLTAPHAWAATPIEEALARQIQGMRRATASDPPSVRAVPYPVWTPEQAGCRGWDDVAWAIVTDNDCVRYSQGELQGEVVETLSRFYRAGKSLHLIATDPSATAHDVADGLAAGFDAGQNTMKCIAKSWIRATLPDGPERDRQLLLIDAASDAVSLSQAVVSVRSLATQGTSGLGSTPRGRAAGGGKLLTTPTQAPGWFDNLFEAASSLHASRLASTQGRLLRARQRLDQCVTAEVEAIYPEVEADALDYIAETRAWAADIEKQVFCEALSEDATLQPAHTAKLDSINMLERSAMQSYGSVVAERGATAQALEQRRAEVETLISELANAFVAADRALGSCDEAEADAAARRLGSLEAERCLQQAEATLGAGRSLRDLRAELERSVAAWQDFFRMMERAERDGDALLSACRFDEVARSFRETFAAFDHRWSRFTVDSLRHCWAPPRRDDEWPADRLEARAGERASAVREKVSAAGAAMARSVEARLACRWREARDALDEARQLLEATHCPPTAPALLDYEASFDRLERLKILLDEREEAVRPKLESLEAARRDLLQALEEAIFVAEDPASPERCAAVERALEMVALAAGFAPPAECPVLSAPGFDEAIDGARRRAEVAAQLGHADLAEAVKSGTEAVSRCDLIELDAAIALLTGLPNLCGADAATPRAALERERRRIAQEIAGFRARIATYEQEWDSAWQLCDTSELRAVANAIAAWSPNACARANLTDGETARVVALEAHTAAQADALAQRAEEVVRVLGAKLELGRGYVRTLERLVGNRRHAVTGAERIAEDARQFVEFVRNYAGPSDLPATCFEAALDEIRSLPPTIERLIGQLGSGDGATESGVGRSEPAETAPARTTSESTADVQTATSQPANDPLRVTVPDLRGQKKRVAVAWLEDLGLHPDLRTGLAATHASEEETVETMAPAAGTAVAPESSVSLWILGAVESTATALTQADCDRRWSGSILVPTAEGRAGACRCPSGTAWSKVRSTCLGLPGTVADPAAGVSCSGMPGTLHDPATGKCRCPVGEWDAAVGRCVDRAAADRERQIGDLEKGAGCERLYADLEIFSSHPEPLYRQMAASARQRANALGCDPARVETAVAASTRFGTPVGEASHGASTSVGSAAAGSTPEPSGSTGAALCVLTDIDYSHVGSGPTAYLAYQNPSTSPGRVPDAYGVLGVPTRIASGDRVSCSGARACLAQVAPSAPFRILGEYSSRSAAAAEARRLCPNPVHTSNY